jgi:hypothetical protein
MAGFGMGEDVQRNGAEAGKAGKCLFFLVSCGPPLLLDGLQRADGGEDVAGFGFFAAGDGLSGGGRMSGRVIWLGVFFLIGVDGRGRRRILAGAGWLGWR